MKKHVIHYDDLKTLPSGLWDAFKTYRLRKQGFDLNRPIFGVSTMEPRQTIYTQRSVLLDTTISTFNYVTSMFTKGILR